MNKYIFKINGSETEVWTDIILYVLEIVKKDIIFNKDYIREKIEILEKLNIEGDLL